jgi:hypothetical protein
MPEPAKINPFREDWRPIVQKVLKAANVQLEGGSYHRNIMAESRWLAELLNTEHAGKRLKELSKEQLDAFIAKAAQWGKDNNKFAGKA